MSDNSSPGLPPAPPGHQILHESTTPYANATSQDNTPHTATHTIEQNAGPEVPLLKTKPRKSPFGALLSRTLPEYSGEYYVGVCDVEVPTARQTFGNFKHKSMPDASAGLAMDSVLFTLFYPTEKPKKPSPVVWFPSLKQTIDGFLKMARRTPNIWYRMVAYPMAAAAVWGTTFPALANAPLLPPPDKVGKWPLMIFSHGVGCSRLMYSAFCGEMASRGYIVAALEHRDGTSPSSRITSEDGEERMLHWLEWTDLEWPDLDPQPSDDTTIRHEQIKLRCAEIEETVRAIRSLTSTNSPLAQEATTLSKGNDPASVAAKEGVPQTDMAERVAAQQNKVVDTTNLMLLGLRAPEIMDWRLWEGKVDANEPVMAGHSLGGAVALELSARNTIPFKAIVAMDPAVQRVEPWQGTLPHPLLVVNSEEFTVGKEYAIWNSQIKDTLDHSIKAESSVFTIPGATHPSFSDIFLILPEKLNRLTGLKVDAAKVIELCTGAVWDFVRGMSQATRMRATEYKPAAPRNSRKTSSATIASIASVTGLGKSFNSNGSGSGSGAETAATSSPSAIDGEEPVLDTEGSSPKLKADASPKLAGKKSEKTKQKDKQKAKAEHEKAKEMDAKGLPRRPVGKIGELIHHPF